MVFPKGLTHKFCLKIEILVKKKAIIVFTEVLHQYKDLHDWKEYLFHQVVIFWNLIFPTGLTSYYNQKLSPAFCLIHVPN